MRIVLIGTGNVGTSLKEAFLAKGITTDFISSRTLEGLPLNADVYIYAVRDTALEEVIARVHVHERAFHLHTSGTMPISVFGADKPHAGVLYPFQTFSKASPLADFSAVPLFIEARGIDDLSAIYSLALTLSSHIYETSQADRERLHVAGVFANNFSNLMFTIAEDLLRGTSIPFKALLPIIDETAAKVHRLSPREAQSGPAQRGDEVVMNRHRKILTPEQLELYNLLSQKIQNLKRP